MKTDMRIQKSILVPVEKQDVVDEYQLASRKRHAYERAVWGSTESMLGRFRWALNELPFEQYHTWLDVGCGEADFFAMAEERGHHFEDMTGIDLTPAMIERAKLKNLSSPAEFLVADMEHLPEAFTGYDLITLLGVLQKCGVDPESVFHALAPHLSIDGQMFITTKNSIWSQFSNGYLQPEVGHSWFNPFELRDIAEACGLKVLRMGGLIPKEMREVEIDQSHTFYILLQRVNS